MAIFPAGDQVDLRVTTRLRYIEAARASLLRDVNDRQHSVMTAFGGPPQVWSGYLDGQTSGAGSEKLGQVLFRVPPGTQAGAFGVFAQGFWPSGGGEAGKVEMKVGAGAYVVVTVPPSSGVEDIQWRWTGNDPAGSANVSRRLGIRANPDQEWATIAVDVRLTRAVLYQIAFIPAHLPISP